MRGWMAFAAGSAVAALFAGAAACSLNAAGTGRGDAGADAVVDSTPPPDDGLVPPPDDGGDAGTEGGVCAPTMFTCNGRCVTTCEGCAVGTAVCQTTRACGTCTGCPGFDILCFTCSGAAPTAYCGARASGGCGGAARCACSDGDAGACPGTNQVCAGGGDGGAGSCFTCGENGTDMQRCGNGQLCSAAAGPPACTLDGG